MVLPVKPIGTDYDLTFITRETQRSMHAGWIYLPQTFEVDWDMD